jgi:hypothetical protein
MILPGAIDAQVAPRQTFLAETRLLQHAHRCAIGGNAARLQTMQLKRPVGEWREQTQSLRHMSATGLRRADPIADAGGLGDAAPNIRQRHRTEQARTCRVKNKERVANILCGFAGVMLETMPEGAAAQFIARPDGFVGNKFGAAGCAKFGPGVIVAHLWRAQRDLRALQLEIDNTARRRQQERHGQLGRSL